MSQTKEDHKELRQLSTILNLDFESQDWGIINANPNRVSEFIDYFDANKHLSKQLQYQIFELIVASYNEAIISELTNEVIENKFVKFIATNTDHYFQPILDYWKKIKNEEFPVGFIL